MNPFDSLTASQLNGLDGFSGLGSKLKKLKNKVKKVIRKVGKVVVPVAAGVLLGPAAGVALGKAVLDHNKQKKESKDLAQELNIPWGEFKNMSEADIEKRMAEQEAAQVAEATQAAAMQQAAQNTILAIDQIRNSPEAQAIANQMLAQGYTPEQVRDYFLRSQPVQTAIAGGVASGVYNQMRSDGYSQDQSAVTAWRAVEEQQAQQATGMNMNWLPVAVSAGLLLLN